MNRKGSVTLLMMVLFHPLESFLFHPSHYANIHNENENDYATMKVTSSVENLTIHDESTEPSSNIIPKSSKKFNLYWTISPSQFYPYPRPLTSDLKKSMEANTHPKEKQSELGLGISILSDWRESLHTYESPPEDVNLIDPDTGYAEYECEVEGNLPNDLVGTLYRNGPGKFGVAGQRVQHVLDADALVFKIDFPPPEEESYEEQRKVSFLSRFVLTKHFIQEQKSQKFLFRGTFGTGPSAFTNLTPKNGLNSDPIELSPISKVLGGAFNTEIKNSANTQIISFGGKVLALFEAGLPYSLDPKTLETLGEDTMGGVLKSALPVKLGENIPGEFVPDFIGGQAHTAHPQMCPNGNLVGWHWSQLPITKSLEVTFTEWMHDGFTPVASRTFAIPDCSLAPHDMAITTNSIVMMINALEMNNQFPFLMNLKGPAASLKMDGRSPVKAWVFPRPTAQSQFEPFCVDVPACFSIHFSHGYEDEDTGNIVTFFSGWPPSNATDYR